MSGSIRRAYADGPLGQTHYRVIGEAGAMPDLYCLHPAPFSGLAFTAIMPHLAQDRRVIAPDFPGHGGSDPFQGNPAIADYAKAICALIAVVSKDEPVDLLGFHTGCLVAAEISLAAPERVRNLVLLDAPAFDPETRAEQRATWAVPPGFTADLSSLAPAWERGITRRIDSQGMARSLEMFAEHLRHGEAMNGGFHAGFSYEVEGRLPQIAHPATVIATGGALLEASRRAAKLVPGARLVERLDITRAVLDEAAETTATTVLDSLGRN